MVYTRTYKHMTNRRRSIFMLLHPWNRKNKCDTGNVGLDIERMSPVSCMQRTYLCTYLFKRTTKPSHTTMWWFKVDKIRSFTIRECQRKSES